MNNRMQVQNETVTEWDTGLLQVLEATERQLGERRQIGRPGGPVPAVISNRFLEATKPAPAFSANPTQLVQG